MPAIDVVADIEIHAEPADIAAVMFDPSRDVEWIDTVTHVEIIDPALARGARVRRTGRVLGREVSWTTTVEAFHFPHLLALQVADGPFAGVLVYEIQRSGAGCRVGIRAVGEPAGIESVPPTMIEGPMRSALGAGLLKLKTLVESPASGNPGVA
jgi:Polyketide cyclase / dehydrase and lipid transport